MIKSLCSTIRRKVNWKHLLAIIVTLSVIIVGIALYVHFTVDQQGIRNEISFKKDQLTEVTSSINALVTHYEKEYEKHQERTTIAVRYHNNLQKIGPELESRKNTSIDDIIDNFAATSSVRGVIGKKGLADRARQICATKKLGPTALFQLTRASEFGCDIADHGIVVKCIVSAITGTMKQDNLKSQLETLKNELVKFRNDREMLKKALEEIMVESNLIEQFSKAAQRLVLDFRPNLLKGFDVAKLAH